MLMLDFERLQRSASVREGGMEVDGAGAEERRQTSPPPAPPGAGEDVAMTGAGEAVEAAEVELEY